MPDYVAYYRVSTVGQGLSGLGLEAQQATVNAFLKDGDRLIDPPFVEVESGRKSDRPELLKALARCRARGATLIVAKVDRLTRSVAFLDTILDSGVEVVFCDLPAVQGHTGRFIIQQMASVAQLEAGLISDRTKAALKAKVEREGQWDRNASHHLVPGAGQAAAAKAVSRRAAGRAEDLRDVVEELKSEGVTSLRGIAHELTARGYCTARGGAWKSETVRRLLSRLDTAT